jgi:cyanophycinase-like exopeptidase
MHKLFLSFIFSIPALGFAQNYTSYFTGNTNDVQTNPEGGICLMGGATEDDNAMIWFLERASGGDVLVLRASGSDGYNTYLYSDLGVTVNSVETIVCHNAAASSDTYVLQKIQQAEAIWFAGGDQWTYTSYWRNTPFSDAINDAIHQRKIVIGGTSAGMAIEGDYYFSAENGTVTSSTAMNNPYHSSVTVDSTFFIDNSILKNTITDTHFDNPDRRGRLAAFLARIYSDYGVYANAIACDEYTAVCIDTTGIAYVFGGYPTYDDNAYFVQANCELSNAAPENCTPSNPLIWNLSGEALKVYQIKGDATGSKSFDLNTWQSGTGGTWLHWSVNNGIFTEQTGSALSCSFSATEEFNEFEKPFLYPNPASDNISILFTHENIQHYVFEMYNLQGEKMNSLISQTENELQVDLKNFPNGFYFLTGQNQKGEIISFKIIKN